MKMRMTALALLLCVLLTACGEEQKDSEGQTSFLEETFGLDEETVLLTVDGREVPAWRYLYWLACACDQVRIRYEETQTPLDWGVSVAEGTLAEYVKSQALADTVLYAVVENLAEKYGYPASWESPSGEAFSDFGLKDTQRRELEAVGHMYGWLYERYCDEESELSPKQGELEVFAGACGVLTLNRILIPAGEDREAARQKAAEIFSRLNGAEDQAAVFAELAAANGDVEGPRTLWPDDEGMDAGLLEAARDLEEGQCSGILESEEGFSILRRLKTDAMDVKERYFDAYLLKAAEEAAVMAKPEYHEIHPEAFKRFSEGKDL